MTEKRDEHCCKIISNDRYCMNKCSRKAKVWVDGKGYCKQHDPREVVKRQKETSAKWKLEWDRKALITNLEQARESAAEKAVELSKKGISLPDVLVVCIKEIIELEKKLENLGK